MNRAIVFSCSFGFGITPATETERACPVFPKRHQEQFPTSSQTGRVCPPKEIREPQSTRRNVSRIDCFVVQATPRNTLSRAPLGFPHCLAGGNVLTDTRPQR